MGVLLVVCFVVRYFMIIVVFAIILMGRRELVALLDLSSWCLVMVVWLFLAVPWCDCVLYMFLMI